MLVLEADPRKIGKEGLVDQSLDLGCEASISEVPVGNTNKICTFFYEMFLFLHVEDRIMGYCIDNYMLTHF